MSERKKAPPRPPLRAFVKLEALLQLLDLHDKALIRDPEIPQPAAAPDEMGGLSADEGVSRSSYFGMRNGERPLAPDNSSEGNVWRLLTPVQRWLNLRLAAEAQNPASLRVFLHKLKLLNTGFVHTVDGPVPSAKISFENFRKMAYPVRSDAPQAADAAVPPPPPDGAPAENAIPLPAVIQTRIDQLRVPRGVTVNMSPDEIDAAVATIVRNVVSTLTGDEILALLAAREDGCTEILLQLTEEQAARLHEAFISGRLPPEFVALREYPTEPNAPAPRPEQVVNLRDATTEGRFFQVLRGALRRDAWIRPFRRLGAVFSPRLTHTSQAHVFIESEQRAYARLSRPVQARSLRVDWLTALLVWPLIAASAVLLLALGLQALGVPVALGVGLACGLTLALVGAQVCGSVLSQLSVGGATMLYTFTFGLSSMLGLAAAGFGGPETTARLAAARQFVLTNPFTAVTGGVLGLVAPAVRATVPWGWALSLLLLVAASIAYSGWVMGQGYRASPVEERNGKRDALWAILGSLAGVAIPAVMGLTALLGQAGLTAPPAFGAAFATVGSLVFGGTVWLVTKSAARSVGFAAGHALLTLLLCALAFHHAGNVTGLVALSAANAWYHATWFTAAFVIAISRGSARAAFVATTLEGAVGFSIFILVRAFQG